MRRWDDVASGLCERANGGTRTEARRIRDWVRDSYTHVCLQYTPSGPARMKVVSSLAGAIIQPS